jgi:hypothetical protein
MDTNCRCSANHRYKVYVMIDFENKCVGLNVQYYILMYNM